MTNLVEAGTQPALVDIRWEFHRAEQFTRYSDVWDELNRDMSETPVLTATFISALLSEFGSGREMIAICYRGQTAQAMTVLRPKNVGFWETLQAAQAPLGAWVNRRPYTLTSFVPSLLGTLPGFALALGVTQQDPNLVRRPENSETCETLDYVETAQITISGTFDEYWAKRGKNLRNNTKKQHNRLVKDGIVPHLDTITDPADVAQAIADYGRLESAGWKATGGTAIHPDNAQGRFYRTVLEAFCQRGAGRIYRYGYGDLIVAMDLCIECRDTLIVLKTTYDESIRDSSPASLLRHEYFRLIFEDPRIKRIEFYGKVMEWHTKWSNEIRTLYHANFYRSPLVLKARGVMRRRITNASAEPASQSPAALHKTIETTDYAQFCRTAGHRPTYTVTTYTDLSALDGTCDPLFSDAGKNGIFYTLPWYRNFVQTVLTPKECLRIYVVESAAAIRAVLMMSYSSKISFLRPKTLIGLSNYYTPLFGPVIAPDDVDAKTIFDTLAAAIGEDEIDWDVIDLHPLADDSPNFSDMMTAFQKAGMLARKYFCFGNWYLPVRGRAYAEYFQTLPSQLKSTMTRKKKQFEKSPDSKLVIYQDATDVEEALNAYEQVYATSWKIPEPYPAFIPGLCRMCAESGRLRLGVAYVDERPAAAQLWIINDGIANIYKLAYDERHAKLSLGTILTAHLMEYVIDVDKVREVDYLTGDDAYKKNWMSHRRERWGIVAYNVRRPRGALAAMQYVTAGAAKYIINAIRRVGAP